MPSRRHRPFAWMLLTALVLTGRAFLPGRFLAPLDLVRDFGVWKADIHARTEVSNPLLSDEVLQFLPWDAAARYRLARGEPPFVNPWAADGRPLWANPQAALLCPTTWPRLLLGRRGWAWCVLARLMLAGAGMYALALELALPGGGALVSGLLYMCSGATFLWSVHPHGNTAAFLPWLLVTQLRLLRGRSRKRFLAAFVAAFLYASGGHPETLLVGAVLAAAVVLLSLRDLPPGNRLASLRAPAVAAAAGLLATGVVTYPCLRAIGGAAAASFRPMLLFRAPPRMGVLASLVLPGFLGSPLRGELDLSRLLPHWGNLFTRSGGYFGLIALACAVAGTRRAGPRMRALAGLAGTFLLLALAPPGLSGLLRLAPVVREVNPVYWAAGVSFLGCLLAGWSLSCAGTSRPVGVLLVAAGALLVAGAAAVRLPHAHAALIEAIRRRADAARASGLLTSPAGYYRGRAEEYLRLLQWTAFRRAAVPGALWIAAGAALLRRRQGLAALCAVLELVAFDAGYLPATRAGRPVIPPAMAAAIRRRDPAGRWLIGAGPAVLPPNAATLAWLRDARSYDALEPPAYFDRLAACGYDAGQASFPDSPDAAQVAAMRRAGIRFLLSRGEPSGATRIAGSSPPRVGLYDLAAADPSPLPENRPPAGLATGAGLSLAGLALAVAGTAGTRRPA